MKDFIVTPELMIFEIFITLILLWSCVWVYLRTRSLFDLSLHKGLHYFSRAFMFFALAFAVRFIAIVYHFITHQQVGLVPYFFFFALYFAGLAGFYLSYCIMWRTFEKDRLKRKHPLRVCILHLVAATLAGIELYLVFQYQFEQHFLFFAVMILILGFAVSHHKCKHPKENHPFRTAIGLGIAVYFVLFLGSLLVVYVPAMHFYMWSIVAVFFSAIAHQVGRLAV